MMKKVVKLTESDLMRIVKRVINEKLEIKIVPDHVPDWEGLSNIMNYIKRNPEQAYVVKDVYDNKLKNPDIFMMEGAHEIVANWQLKQYLKIYGNQATHIYIENCEGVDLLDINLCEYPNLATLILRGTPNNLEETQNKECYEKRGHVYFFRGHSSMH